MRTWLINRTPGFLVRFFAAPYIAGDSAGQGRDQALALWETRRIRSTLDLLGEDLRQDEEGNKTVLAYLRLVETLGKQEYATISLKPTQFGTGEQAAGYLGKIREVVESAARSGIPVTLDMEDHRQTNLTLELYRRLKPEFPNLGVVLQSRLHRTRDDILALRGLSARVRICIGIYLEPREVALQDKPVMKGRLLEYVALLLAEGHYLEIATHDEAVVRRANEIASRLNPAGDRFEFQMLLGVPRQALQDELVRQGRTVRLYVPYAERWSDAISYCKRRLAANPSLGLMTLKNLLHRRPH